MEPITPETRRYILACSLMDRMRSRENVNPRRVAFLRRAVRTLHTAAQEAVAERDRIVDRNLASMKESVRMAFGSPTTTHA